MFNNSYMLGNFFYDFHLVCNHNDGNSQFFINIFQQLENGFYCFRVQGTCCFIRQKDGWVGDNGAGNADALFLSAGKLCGIFISVVCQSD